MMYEAQKRYSRKQSAAVADIGVIPPVANPKRRESCRQDLHRYLKTYFPHSTGLTPFSKPHLRAIHRIELCAFEGGRFAQAFPRGFAKTTIGENSVLWVITYGHRKFAPLFGGGASEAKEMIESIKMELTENDLLYADFPEICHPIRSLEGKPQRCGSQTHTIFHPCDDCSGTGKVMREQADGPPAEGTCRECWGSGTIGDPQLTHISWTSDQIVLPTIRQVDGVVARDAKIENTPASGGIIITRGITAGTRGMKYKRPDGTQQRPDFVLGDDLQSDESAGSESQIDKRMGVLKKAIMKMGGHRKQLAVVVNGTVIERGDMMDQLLDPKLNPAWQGERIKMIEKWADEHIGKTISGRSSHWTTYAEIRNNYDTTNPLDQKRAHRQATTFYKKNRKAMDAGAAVTWEHCFDPVTELSAIQHAYNLFIDDGPDVFASECQNEPLVPETLANLLTVEQVKAKAVKLGRGMIPLAMSRLVCHIDVQKDSLWWSVFAGTDAFSTHLVDDGVWPEQRRVCQRKADVELTLRKKYPGTGVMGAITAGLQELTKRLEQRDFTREGDGAKIRLERGSVDSRWGDSTDNVKRFLREKGGIWLAAEGQYIGPASKPMAQFNEAHGEKIGYHWILKTSAAGRVLKADVNFWKSFVEQSIRTAVGDRVTMTLYGEPSHHEGTASHLTSEYPSRLKNVRTGAEVDVWKLIVGRDNEKLDNAVGCCVLLSFLGCDPLKGQVSAGVKVKTRLKLSEIQGRARRAS